MTCNFSITPLFCVHGNIFVAGYKYKCGNVTAVTDTLLHYVLLYLFLFPFSTEWCSASHVAGSPFNFVACG